MLLSVSIKLSSVTHTRHIYRLSLKMNFNQFINPGQHKNVSTLGLSREIWFIQVQWVRKTLIYFAIHLGTILKQIQKSSDTYCTSCTQNKPIVRIQRRAAPNRHLYKQGEFSMQRNPRRIHAYKAHKNSTRVYCLDSTSLLFEGPPFWRGPLKPSSTPPGLVPVTLYCFGG